MKHLHSTDGQGRVKAFRTVWNIGVLGLREVYMIGWQEPYRNASAAANERITAIVTADNP